MHGPREWVVRQIRLAIVSGEQLREVNGAIEDEGRGSVSDEFGPLGRRQCGIDHDGHHTHAQRTVGEGQHVTLHARGIQARSLLPVPARTGDHDGDAIAGDDAPLTQGRGDLPGAHLGIGCRQDLHPRECSRGPGCKITPGINT